MLHNALSYLCSLLTLHTTDKQMGIVQQFTIRNNE